MIVIARKNVPSVKHRVRVGFSPCSVRALREGLVLQAVPPEASTDEAGCLIGTDH